MIARPILSSLILASLTAPLAAEEGRTVAVRGTATLSVQPDYLSWNVQIAEVSEEAVKSVAIVQERTKQALALAKEFDIVDKDIEASRLYVGVERDHDDRGNPIGPVRYRATRTVALKQRDFSRTDEMIPRMFQDIAQGVSLSYESSQMVETRLEAWDEAARVAREKAQRMLAPLDARPGRLVRLIEDGEQAGDFDRGNPYLSNYASNNIKSYYSASAPAPDSVTGSFLPGLSQVTVTVHVVFEVVDGASDKWNDELLSKSIDPFEGTDATGSP